MPSLVKKCDATRVKMSYEKDKSNGEVTIEMPGKQKAMSFKVINFHKLFESFPMV